LIRKKVTNLEERELGRKRENPPTIGLSVDEDTNL
jgi:hypothetical protein